MGVSRLRLVLLVGLVGFGLAVAMAAPAVGAHSDPAIIEALDQDGRYLELDDPALDTAIDRANDDGIAFARLDQNGDGRVATSLADDYVEDLAEIGSRYHTVVVLTAEGFGASSDVFEQSELDAALDASFNSFRADNPGQGLDTFSATVTGSQTTATTAPAPDDGDTGTSGGFSVGWLLAIVAAVGAGFLAIRAWINSRRRKKQAANEMEQDRAEIREQLKNNADRVIALGDKVIAKADDELISMYEEASAAYQEVSLGVETASSPEEVDALDDRIDHAEWQFEVIEARLDGRPTPRSPADRQRAETAGTSLDTPPPPTSPPAPGAPPARPAEPPVATSPRTGRRYPRTSGSRRRGSGGLGGLGGALGGILGSVILGGGLGGGNRSRRSQRRTGSPPMGSGGLGSGGLGSGGLGGGGLGGGVLRRGGARSGPKPRSRSRSRSRSSKRSGGGRSFGRRKSKGGRNF